MKNFKSSRIIFIVALTLLLCLSLAACDSEEPEVSDVFIIPNQKDISADLANLDTVLSIVDWTDTQEDDDVYEHTAIFSNEEHNQTFYVICKTNDRGQFRQMRLGTYSTREEDIELLLELYPYIISALNASDYYDEMAERQGIIENGTRLKEDLTVVLGRVGYYKHSISVNDEGVSIEITKPGL